jgi:hypothetical protein
MINDTFPEVDSLAMITMGSLLYQTHTAAVVGQGPGSWGAINTCKPSAAEALRLAAYPHSFADREKVTFYRKPTSGEALGFVGATGPQSFADRELIYYHCATGSHSVCAGDNCVCVYCERDTV